jgi:tetraacyldisaccharide 4'-kinase
MQIFRIVLFPFAVLYDLVTRLRNYFYDKGYFKSTSYPVPVICVGNLSVGGTGKSPMIAYLVSLLSPTNDVVVLSRGYGRKTKGYIEVEVSSTSKEVGDEPLQIKKKYPNIRVVVCEDRRTAIEKLKFKADVILMDDGFQHRKVKPTFNIILSAFGSLFSADYLLPTGNLRESKKGAARAGMIVVTKCPPRVPYATLQQIEYDLKLQVHQKIFFTTIGYEANLIGSFETLPLDYLKQKKFTLVTGIAKPAPLVQFLKEKKFNFTHNNYPDHHEFSDAEISELKKEELLITTEKDFMRLQPRLGKFALFYLPIKTQFLNNRSPFFDERIREVVENFKRAE